MNFEKARFNMIEQQIRPWDVLDQDVLSLLAAVKREDFVPADQRELAFVDTEIALPNGGHMLAPRVEARLLQELKLGRHEKVLEIGTGAGFLSALLGHRAHSVITLEADPAQARVATENLRRAGVLNVKVREVDGARGLPAEAPFDAILLSGSVAEVPRELLEQLKPGGRLVAIVGEAPVMCAKRYTRVGADQFQCTELFDTVAARLRGFAQPSAFEF